MKKGLSLLLIISILSFTIVSATLYDFVKEQSEPSENTFIVDEKDCSSFEYNLYVRWLRNFIIEVKTTDTNEQFYIILRENHCEWNVDILKEVNRRPDILITGEWNEENPECPYLDNRKIQAKSLKGLIFSRAVNDYL